MVVCNAFPNILFFHMLNYVLSIHLLNNALRPISVNLHKVGDVRRGNMKLYTTRNASDNIILIYKESIQYSNYKIITLGVRLGEN